MNNNGNSNNNNANNSNGVAFGFNIHFIILICRLKRLPVGCDGKLRGTLTEVVLENN